MCRRDRYIDCVWREIETVCLWREREIECVCVCGERERERERERVCVERKR